MLVEKIGVIEESLFVSHILTEKTNFPNRFGTLEVGILSREIVLESRRLLRIPVDDDVEVLIGAVDIGVIVVETIFLKAGVALLTLKVPLRVVSVTRGRAPEEVSLYAKTLRQLSDIRELGNLQQRDPPGAPLRQRQRHGRLPERRVAFRVDRAELPLGAVLEPSREARAFLHRRFAGPGLLRSGLCTSQRCLDRRLSGKAGGKASRMRGSYVE